MIPPEEEKARLGEEEKVVSKTTVNETILQLKELGIDVQRSAKQHQEQQQGFLHNDSNLMLIIVDQSLSLTAELDEDVTNEETSGKML